MSLLHIQREIATIEPGIVFRVFGFPIANSTLLITVITLLIAAFCFFAVRKFTLYPGKFQVLVEEIYLGMCNLIVQITGNKKMADKIFPLIGSLLVFIFISNFIGLIPGITVFSFGGDSVFRTPTADVNTTLGLAVGCMLVIHGTMLKQKGVFGYLGTFFKVKEVVQGFRSGIKSGLLSLVDLFIGLLDIIGELAKIVSLSLRLFGNMYAGDVLATILLGLFAYVIPAAWLGMNLLSAVVQAVVFSALVTVFYSLAVSPEDE